MKKIAASFASSEGWMPRPPMLNQRRALFTGGLNMHRDQPERDHRRGRSR